MWYKASPSNMIKNRNRGNEKLRYERSSHFSCATQQQYIPLKYVPGVSVLLEPLVIFIHEARQTTKLWLILCVEIAVEWCIVS